MKFDLLSTLSLRFRCDHFYQIMYSPFAVVEQDEVLVSVLNNAYVEFWRCIMIYRGIDFGK